MKPPFDAGVTIHEIVDELYIETMRMWRREFKLLYEERMRENRSGRVVNFEDSFTYFVASREKELQHALDNPEPLRLEDELGQGVLL